jgi:hypothetical protein
VAAPTGIGPVSLSGCGDPQRLKQLGDEMLDTTVALSTTRDALIRLIEGHTDYASRNIVQVKPLVEDDDNDIYHQFMELVREVDWLLQQTDGLRQKSLGTSQLVRIAEPPSLHATLITRAGLNLHGSRQRPFIGRSWQRSTRRELSNT